MKGAYLLAEDPLTFEKATAEILARGGDTSRAPGFTTIEDASGRMFLMSDATEPELTWEFQNPPHWPAYAGMEMPDLAKVSGFSIECRWEDLFASEVARIASLIDGPAWVLDEKDVVWPANAVDPAHVAL